MNDSCPTQYNPLYFFLYRSPASTNSFQNFIAEGQWRFLSVVLMKSSLDIFRTLVSSPVFEAISSTKSLTFLFALAAPFSTVIPCSSVPVKNQTSSPVRANKKVKDF